MKRLSRVGVGSVVSSVRPRAAQPVHRLKVRANEREGAHSWGRVEGGSSVVHR